MSRLILSAIVARSRNRVIGREGDLPWRLSSDLKHFKRLTMGKPCIMGRKTWESLPGILPGRPHLVLTRDPNYEAEGADVYQDIRTIVGRAAGLAGESGQSEVMIIGGAEIYHLFLPYLDRIYETVVQAEMTGDAVFPELDPDNWKIEESRMHKAGPRDDFDFVTQRLERDMGAKMS